jgi:AcrR family transcriptional regulator
MSSKTARGENSRQKILDTTRILIGESDSHSVSLDQIAKACQLSKSSILWHFGSKEGLLVEVVDAIFRNLETTFLSQCPAGLTVPEKFKFFLDQYEQLLANTPEIPIIFFSFVFNKKIKEKIDRKIREIYNWNRETLMAQLNVSREQAQVLLAMLNGVVIQWHVDPEQIDIKAAFKEMMSIVEMIVER